MRLRTKLGTAALAMCVVGLVQYTAQGQRGQQQRPATLGLDQGTLDFATPQFDLKLVKASQTIAALAPKGADGFDFTPADRLTQRAADGYNHLGDITMRVRAGNTGAFTAYSTSTARQPVTALAADGKKTLAAADLTPTLAADCPLQVTRSWQVDNNGKLVLHFDIKNKTNGPVEIGAMGFPMVFNNIITGRNLAQANATCSFFDPAIAQDAGYLQVTRLSGGGPALVVVPEGKTPFEAWRNLQEPTGNSQTFEGAFEWMVNSTAYAQNEWRNAKPWNPPTSTTLAAGQTVSHGFEFLVSDTIKDIEKTLADNKRPVAVGLPGYILPMDLDGKLFLNYAGHKVTGVEADPVGGITAEALPATKTGWLDYSLKGHTWGRVRLTLTYDDGTREAVNYYVTKPAAEAVADLGNFSFTKQWFVDPTDPFHRSPSVMTYDRANNKIVTSDTRVWISGLGDEGGSGSWLAAGMKEYAEPKKEEVAKYEQFIDQVLWGSLQFKDGPLAYGVKKSVFFYEPALVPGYQYGPGNWTSWTSWNKATTEDVFQRAYNYPHVVAAYWAMYRLARNNPGLVTNHPWDWYLNQAYATTNFMLNGRRANGRGGVGYLNTGLMEGDVFVMLLKDMKAEGAAWADRAATIETGMKRRADQWNRQAFPYGSEMAWDSTGQEEVYAWTTYFGYTSKAEDTINSILGYMPTIPHWGYNGDARRYWDFQYGGAPGRTSRIERQIHHYGSGINSIPMLAEFRAHPDDFYLLRVGYGGSMGALSNIDQEGFSSAAFHTFPDTLRWDAYSGDYGPNFFGHAITTGTYLIDHPDFGWQALGGNVKVEGDWVKATPLDSERRRVFVAPLALYLTLDAGTFDRVEVNAKTHAVRVGLSPKSEFTPAARLHVEQTAKVQGVGTYAPPAALTKERDGYTIPLEPATNWVELTAK